MQVNTVAEHAYHARNVISLQIGNARDGSKIMTTNKPISRTGQISVVGEGCVEYYRRNTCSLTIP